MIFAVMLLSGAAGFCFGLIWAVVLDVYADHVVKR